MESLDCLMTRVSLERPASRLHFSRHLTGDAHAAPGQAAAVLADRAPDAEHHADFEAQRHGPRHDGHAAVLAEAL